VTEEIKTRQTAEEGTSAAESGQRADTGSASRNGGTERKAMASWAVLLDEAVKKPGFIHEAYSRFHTYSLGNQLLALFQCLERGIQPGPLGTFPKWKELGRYMNKGMEAGITSEVLQLLNCRSLVLGGWVHVAHGHLDVGVAGEFAEGWEVDPGHGHAGQGRVAEVVETKRWVNCRLLERLDVGFAKPAYGSIWIVTRCKDPLGRNLGHPTRENREGAFGEWYRAPRK